MVHISTISSSIAINSIRKSKIENNELKVTCESSGPFIHFSSSDIKEGDTRFKTHPPIREERNKEILIDLLKLGCIDTITSFHRPVKPSLKYMSSGDFKRAVSGVSSIGTTLQCCLKAIQKDPKEDAVILAKLLSQRPAEIIGIEKFKGSIAVDKFADLIIWNPSEHENIKCEYMRYPSISPFHGEDLPGKVFYTYLRGDLVYNCGEFTAKGRPLKL